MNFWYFNERDNHILLASNTNFFPDHFYDRYFDFSEIFSISMLTMNLVRFALLLATGQMSLGNAFQLPPTFLLLQCIHTTCVSSSYRYKLAIEHRLSYNRIRVHYIEVQCQSGSTSVLLHFQTSFVIVVII